MNTKNDRIPQIKAKLGLAGYVLGIRQQSDWLDYFQYADTGNVSRVLGEEIGINPHDLARVCKALTDKNNVPISGDDFFQTALALSEKLNIPRDIATTIIGKNHSGKTKRKSVLSEADERLLSKMHGNYKGVYQCRDIKDSTEIFFTIENYSIFRFEKQNGTCAAQQIGNFAAGDNPVGHVSSRNERIVFNLEYGESNFPDSQMLLRVAYQDDEDCVLTGLYMDISNTAAKPIFCVPIMLFKYEGLSDTRKIGVDSSLYELCKSVLTPNEDCVERGRLINRTDADFDDELTRVAMILSKEM